MSTSPYLEKKFATNELMLAYQEWGSSDGDKATIITLHGFGVSGHMYDEFSARFKDIARIINLDQRGHGDSEISVDGNYQRTAFVDDLEHLRKYLGIEKFILIGHSMGGLNAVEYAVRYPEHISVLIIVDAGPESAKDGVDNIVRFTRGPDELEFDEFVQMALNFNPRRSEKNIRDRMHHRLRQLDNGKWTWKFDKRFRDPEASLKVGSEITKDQLWDQFRQVKAPTLLIRGSESDVLSGDIAKRTVQEMENAYLEVVKGAGHSVPGDSPDGFADTVRVFLEKFDAGEIQKKRMATNELNYSASSSKKKRKPSWAKILIFSLATLISAVIFFTVRRSNKNKNKNL